MQAFAYMLLLPSSWFYNFSFFIISGSSLSRFPKTSTNKRGECENHERAKWPEEDLISFQKVAKNQVFNRVSSIFCSRSNSKFHVHEISERERR